MAGLEFLLITRRSSHRTRPRLRLAASASLLLLALAWNAEAQAETVSAENKAAARELAVEGFALAEKGKCEEALVPLTKAESLFHAPSILAWIGECQINLGLLVEGTENLNRVVRENLASNAPDVYVKAQERARKLLKETKPKIARLTIAVSGPSGDLSNTPGLQVRVDGKAVPSALIGASRPTDPGKRLVEVLLEGYQPQTLEVELAPGKREQIQVALVPAAVPAGETLSEEPAEEPPEETPTPSEQAKKGKTMTYLGWGLVGGGALALAGGGTMGVLALSKKNSLSCDDDGRCPPSESQTLDQAKSFATASTILFAAGGALAAGGLVVLLVSKGGKKETATLLPEFRHGDFSLRPDVGWGSVSLSGQF